ncbi:hypothetical protein MMC18_000228 [Xylographa bjoerkii]|nr:hypothetical protein [Xylographa bjoerkii]
MDVQDEQSEDGMKELWQGGHSFLSDEEERRVLFAALDSFRQYRRAAHHNVTHRRRQNFYALPTTQWQLLAAPPFSILSSFDRVDDAIDANADIASEILKASLEAFGLQSDPPDPAMNWKGAAKPSDIDKARSTIRQLYRDWSAEGADERSKSFEPVLSNLANLFPKEDKGTTKVLVPGSGLGRLAFEVYKLGYEVEGNELSYHQLMTSNWILNNVVADQQFDLYPFALTFSNHTSRENQLKCVKIPDVHPSTELDVSNSTMPTHATGRMSMTAADFVVLYGDEKYHKNFDAVVTVFFVDTAPNVLRYIEVIHNCLKDGGYWINLGPLLWHFEESRGPPAERGNSRQNPAEEKALATTRAAKERQAKVGIEEPGSIELTNEEVLLLVERMGFNIQSHHLQEGTGYIQDPESMLRNLYSVSHWVARKV